MAQRITKKHLQAKIDIINGMTGHEEGTVGAVQYAGAYGMHGVHRLDNDAGGVGDLMGGYHTAREVASFLSGMIAALRIADVQV